MSGCCSILPFGHHPGGIEMSWGHVEEVLAEILFL